MYEKELINDRNNMKPVMKLFKVCMCPDIFDLFVLNFRLNPTILVFISSSIQEVGSMNLGCTQCRLGA